MGASWDSGNAHRVLLGKLMVPLILVSASDELKNKTVCEDHELKLHCHESKFLNIYSATYGRRTQERHVCSSEAERLPHFGKCLMWVLSGCCWGDWGSGPHWLVPWLERKSRARGTTHQGLPPSATPPPPLLA